MQVRAIRLLTCAIICIATTCVGLACNIPVFRYALERWQTDTMELVVFHDSSQKAAAEEQLKSISPRMVERGGNLNLNITYVAVDDSTRETESSSGSSSTARREEHLELWNRLKATSDPKLPYGVLRGQHQRGPFVCWQGGLSDVANAQIASSLLREQLAKQLTDGDAVVWILVLSEKDQEANETMRQTLKSQAASLAKTIELPEGIGLPGSELFSEVPLLLQFSTLEIERSDARERFLLGLCKGFQPKAFAEDQPLVIPVFGRGRALEVIPASQASPRLVEDLTMFLCAACSCQVKEQNPGFDLLIDVDWESALFGADGERPPASSAEGLKMKQKEATLLEIPPGR